MSYYDDQEEAWLANDCKGSPSDYDPYDADSWPSQERKARPPKSKQKRGPLHCLTCGAEIPPSGVCPKASKQGKKPATPVTVVNCEKAA